MNKSKDDAMYKSMASSDDNDTGTNTDDDTAIFGDDTDEPDTGLDSGYMNDQDR